MATTFENAVEMAAESLRDGVPFGDAVGLACQYHGYADRGDFHDVALALSARSAAARGARSGKHGPDLRSIMGKINAQPLPDGNV